jgi:GNAT superfamily N-acetyltransferase
MPEPINATHVVRDFDCGKIALNNWLQVRALSNHKNGFTAVMVVQRELRVVGFFGLAPTSAPPPIFPRSLKTGQPPDPIPCLLLGQLAVDRSCAGQGLGSVLLKHAYIRTVAAAKLVGGRALLVNAIDDEAADYWRRKGFKPTHENPKILFQSMKDIEATLDKM